MKVIVHGGANEIGAACIEIASTTTRIILDCGWPLDGSEINPPPPPPVPGLFTPGPPPNAVLLAHAHPDHTGFIPQIPAPVPIYATVDTSKIMTVGRLYAHGRAISRAAYREAPMPRSGREKVRPFDIGDLSITAYPVDHSSPGAVGYLVEGDGQRFFYTGDLRFHGRKPGMHQRIVKELRGKLDLLITEGTNVGREQSGLTSEDEVEERAVRLIRSCDSLVMAAYSPQNLDRFVSYFRAALRSRRIFVCDHYQAAVLYQLNNSALPKPSREKLRVYRPRKQKRLEAYAKHFTNAAIDLEEILAAPDKFMMLARPSILRNDFQNRLPAGTTLLYGMWSGYRTKQDWQEAEQTLASAEGKIIECHASGHAHGDYLFDFIEQLRPASILPVHTNAREVFQQHFGAKRFLPQFSSVQ